MRFYLAYSLRANTQRTYTSQQRTFVTICGQLGIDHEAPLTEFHLCAVVSVYARTYKRTTIGGFVSAVSNLSHTLGHGQLPRGETFRRLLQGIDNFHADQVVKPKRAVTVADLIAIHRLIDHSTFEGARDWCACTLAFFALLRINEYANGGLQHQHVSLTAAGVMIVLPYTKTSLVPTRVDIAARADILCPSQALSSYLAFFKRFPALPQKPTDSLFISRRSLTDYQNMTDTEFVAIVRSLLQRGSTHFDATQYAGHSFRRGGTSALKLAGVADSTIQRHGRWKSDVFRDYIDVEHNVALRLLATQSLPSVTSDRQPVTPGRPAGTVAVTGGCVFCSLAPPRLVISIGAPPYR